MLVSKFFSEYVITCLWRRDRYLGQSSLVFFFFLFYQTLIDKETKSQKEIFLKFFENLKLVFRVGRDRDRMNCTG